MYMVILHLYKGKYCWPLETRHLENLCFLININKAISSSTKKKDKISQEDMATAEARQANIRRFLEDIKNRNIGNTALEVNSETNMLHMNRPLEGWREWSPLTYNHNVLGHMLLTETEQLKKMKEELENMIKMLSPPMPFGFPGSYPPNFMPFSFPTAQGRSAEAKLEDQGTDPEEKQ